MGTVPPVAGGHLGMNLHLSEVVSDLIEPLVDMYKDGRKCMYGGHDSQDGGHEHE